jgi:hypothetical protein
LKQAFFEYLRKFSAKLVHVIAQLHYRDYALDLVVDLVPAKFLQPLMVVSQELGIGVFLPQPSL